MSAQLELPTDEPSSDARPLSSIASPSIELPEGYTYGVTRAADLIPQALSPDGSTIFLQCSRAVARRADGLFEKRDLDEIDAFHAWIAKGGIS